MAEFLLSIQKTGFNAQHKTKEGKGKLCAIMNSISKKKIDLQIDLKVNNKIY